MKFPIICYPKHGKYYKTLYTNYNGWVYSPDLEISDNEFGNNEVNSEDSSDIDEYVYKDSNGNRIGGIFNINDVKYIHTTIINKGYEMTTYTYPNINIPFKSKMVNWWNLFYCGGFSITGPNEENYSDQKLIIDAVINKSKPLGFSLIKRNELSSMINKVQQYGLCYTTEPHIFGENNIFINISQSLTFGETFNIKNWLESYRLMSCAINSTLLTDNDEKFFLSLKNKPLAYWLTDWDYANPKSNRDLALTGLLLGYPIESTVALMIQ